MSLANSEKSKRKHEKMMQCGHSMSVQIKGDREDIATQGEIRIQHWNQRERIFRAFKFGAACWGIALVSIIIPLLHFFLVPGFLLAGPIVAFFVMGQNSVVLGGEGVCPNCREVLPIARTSFRFPISDLCSRCQCSVKISAL